uniref:Uncharacterized protein n=1 Tax=Oryza brachyantha TaxID=4533 RepID=J3M5W1_ORYBR
MASTGGRRRSRAGSGIPGRAASSRRQRLQSMIWPLLLGRGSGRRRKQAASGYPVGTRAPIGYEFGYGFLLVNQFGYASGRKCGYRVGKSIILFVLHLSARGMTKIPLPISEQIRKKWRRQSPSGSSSGASEREDPRGEQGEESDGMEADGAHVVGEEDPRGEHGGAHVVGTAEPLVPAHL